MVNLGGDIAIVGPHPGGAPWRIGVRDPKAPETAMATLLVSLGGVATSGCYERYWDIDGRRIRPYPQSSDRLASLRAIVGHGWSEELLGAGLYSTVAMLKGEAGPRWLRENGVSHVFVDASGRLDLTGIAAPEDAAGPKEHQSPGCPARPMASGCSRARLPLWSLPSTRSSAGYSTNSKSGVAGSSPAGCANIFNDLA